MTDRIAGLALLAGALALVPSAAKAQNTGTMQVTVQVVATQPSSTALQAALGAVRGAAGLAQQSSTAVPTVASISVSYRPSTRAEAPALVVAIDYARN